MAEVVQKGEFNVVGFSVAAEARGVSSKIISLWEQLRARQDEIRDQIGARPVGVCVMTEKSKSSVKYVAGCEVKEFSGVPVDMNMEIISEAKYRTFGWKGKVADIAQRVLDVRIFITSHTLKDQGFWLEFFDTTRLEDEQNFEILVAVD